VLSKKFSFNEIWQTVENVQKQARQRCLTESDVKRAINLRNNSVRNEVVAWGGFVPNCYNYKAFSTKLSLMYNGDIYCCRNSSCSRSFARGNYLFERGPLFGLLMPSKYPKWFPKINNDGTLSKKISKEKLLKVMLRDRQYGLIIRELNKKVT